mmetsp:Transcript_97010/g.279175  ORF Transcript_97010/g.279175 Transcript_97010/m.279175 type:complete len:372 (+) Transcript_97010:622-1737(+)
MLAAPGTVGLRPIVEVEAEAVEFGPHGLGLRRRSILATSAVLVRAAPFPLRGAPCGNPLRVAEVAVERLRGGGALAADVLVVAAPLAFHRGPWRPCGLAAVAVVHVPDGPACGHGRPRGGRGRGSLGRARRRRRRLRHLGGGPRRDSRPLRRPGRALRRRRRELREVRLRRRGLRRGPRRRRPRSLRRGLPSLLRPVEDLILVVVEAIPDLDRREVLSAVVGHVQATLRMVLPMDLVVVERVGEPEKARGFIAAPEQHDDAVLVVVPIEGHTEVGLGQPTDESVAAGLEELPVVAGLALGGRQPRPGALAVHRQALPRVVVPPDRAAASRQFEQRWVDGSCRGWRCVRNRRVLRRRRRFRNLRGHPDGLRD